MIFSCVWLEIYLPIMSSRSIILTYTLYEIMAVTLVLVSYPTLWCPMALSVTTATNVIITGISLLSISSITKTIFVVSPSSVPIFPAYFNILFHLYTLIKTCSDIVEMYWKLCLCMYLDWRMKNLSGWVSLPLGFKPAVKILPIGFYQSFQ